MRFKIVCGLDLKILSTVTFSGFIKNNGETFRMVALNGTTSICRFKRNTYKKPVDERSDRIDEIERQKREREREKRKD